MVLTKEHSPTRIWSQFALDFGCFLAEPPQSSTAGQFLQRIDKEWTDSEKRELSEIFGNKKRKNLPNSGLKALLFAFEGERTDAELLLLCRVLDTIWLKFAAENNKKGEKVIVKADALATLCRVCRKRLLVRVETSNLNMDMRVDQILFKLMTNVGLKDNRFGLKVRMSGIVPALCRIYIKNDVQCSMFYPLFVRVARSPRNGQLIGRQDGFMAKLLANIKQLDTADQAEQILILDKLLQILFYTIKNKRIRTMVIRDSICKTMLEMLKRHLNQSTHTKPARLLSSIFGTYDGSVVAAHTEVVNACLGILRSLANNKKARDELISLGTMETCARELKDFWSEEWKSGSKAKIVDSLCALCLRCMPPLPYPLENVRFPLDFPLPQQLATMAPPGVMGGGRTRNSPSFNISFDNGRSSDEDGIDEEDEVFHEQGMQFEQSEDEDGGGNSKQMVKDQTIPKTTKLTTTQLAKYAPFFVEMEQGTMQPTFSMIYQNGQETWRVGCEKTKHVMPVHSLLPYEMFTTPAKFKEKLAKTANNMKKMIVEELDNDGDRLENPKVVYDLDKAAFDGLPFEQVPFPSTAPKLDPAKDLLFDSRFESGNLRRATQVAPTHYELVLSPDLNQMRDHYQWFFFQVSNMRKSVKYTFEIVNCMKSTSMYSQGMQPVMYSVLDGAAGWRRVGDNVCYYRNLYTNEAAASTPTGNGVTTASTANQDGDDKKKKNYYSIRFNITFQHTGDVCYFAYHYPYTYSFLNSHLMVMRKKKLDGVYFREDVIGHSLAGNPVKMLTITSPAAASEIAEREVIVLSARVHPGESNSSWIMQGVLESLICGQTAELYRLRQMFVFKVIPMLNPDGVINGSHRCSLAGIDLNRVWDRPNEQLHPEIYHSKAILQYMVDTLNKKPFAFVDLHGHSKKWDYFVFGNNIAESWRPEEIVEGHDEEEHLALPRALEKNRQSKFNPTECRFNITRAKESSARGNVWRQFGVATAYTLESTYCGFQHPLSKGYQVNTTDLKDIGKELLYAFLEMKHV